MLSASEKYAKEATAVWHGSHFAIFMFGLNQRRQEAIGILTETFGGAGGARTFADGIDVGGEIPNPIGRMANVETTEATFPVRYLFRRARPDTGGPGRWRGGNAIEFALVQHDSPEGGINYVVSGKGTEFSMSEGLGGGYAGAPCAYRWVHNNEAREAGGNVNPFPASLGDMTGEAEDHLVGRVPAQGRRCPLCPLRRRRRLRRPAGARARAGAGRHRGRHGVRSRGGLGLWRAHGQQRRGRSGDPRQA